MGALICVPPFTIWAAALALIRAGQVLRKNTMNRRKAAWKEFPRSTHESADQHK